MLFGHGWKKMMNFSVIVEKGFPDPLGIGVAMSLAGAVVSEVVFAALIMVGLAALYLIVRFAQMGASFLEWVF